MVLEISCGVIIRCRRLVRGSCDLRGRAHGSLCEYSQLATVVL